MRYRRFVSDVVESLGTVTFALVVRTVDNSFTYGGGYATVAKPIPQIAFDTVVQKIVDEGDFAFPKKLSASDRATLNPIAPTAASRQLENIARASNALDKDCP